MESCIIGIDVGQKHDPTAIVVCECQERPTDRMHKTFVADPLGIADQWIEEPKPETVYVARYMTRIPLNTAYPEQAKAITNVATQVAERQYQAAHNRLIKQGVSFIEEDKLRHKVESNTWILADATGVGGPVIDVLRESLQGYSMPLTAVSFRHGDMCDVTPHSRDGRLGKAYLVSRLQALLQTRRIELPETEEARVLAEELRGYEIKVSEDAKDTYGAFRVGTHDDLATALGLATLLDPADYRMELVPTPWE